MPFPFKSVCELLEALETIQTKYTTPTTPQILEIERGTSQEISSWFAKHQDAIDTIKQPAALLSTVMPDKRVDRSTNQPSAKIGANISKALGLGKRGEALRQNKKLGDGEFALLVQRTMAASENPVPSPGNEVTVEEVDDALNFMGSRSSNSTNRERLTYTGDWENSGQVIRKLYSRFSSIEAKWFIRIMKKAMKPIVVPMDLFLNKLHFLLPLIFQVRASFMDCFNTMDNPLLKHLPRRVPKGEQAKYMAAVSKILKPLPGCKVQRLEFVKARSLAHAAKLAGKGKVALERKYDGEYCQIHINSAKLTAYSPHGDSIEIFSKSGRNSTHDRISLHPIVRSAFGIGSPEGKTFKSDLIVEGEMLVYSESKEDFMEFSEIRKHVRRDYQWTYHWKAQRPGPGEHLCIVLYDILSVDGQSLLTAPYHERRAKLEEITRLQKGRVFIADMQEVDLSIEPEGPRKMKEIFAESCARGHEGLVLKPWEAPYLGMGLQRTNGWIKLKKDYIAKLGDTLDVAILGSSRIRRRAENRRNLMYEHVTTYYIGLCTNRAAVERYKGTKPNFKIVDTVSHGLSKQQKEALEKACVSHCIDEISHPNAQYGEITIDVHSPPMETFIWPPVVFEVVGGGFHKPSNQDYHVLRWPRVSRVYSSSERRWEDCPSFQDVQEMAQATLEISEEAVSQEEMEWNARLDLHGGLPPIPGPSSPGRAGTTAVTTSYPDKNGLKRSHEDDVVVGNGKRCRPSIDQAGEGGGGGTTKQEVPLGYIKGPNPPSPSVPSFSFTTTQRTSEEDDTQRSNKENSLSTTNTDSMADQNTNGQRAATRAPAVNGIAEEDESVLNETTTAGTGQGATTTTQAGAGQAATAAANPGPTQTTEPVRSPLDGQDIFIVPSLANNMLLDRKIILHGARMTIEIPEDYSMPSVLFRTSSKTILIVNMYNAREARACYASMLGQPNLEVYSHLLLDADLTTTTDWSLYRRDF